MTAICLLVVVSNFFDIVIWLVDTQMKCDSGQMKWIWIAIIGLAASSSLTWATESPNTYSQVKEIAVGGKDTVQGMVVDEKAHRLFVASDAKIKIIDLAKNAVMGEIGGAAGLR